MGGVGVKGVETQGGKGDFDHSVQQLHASSLAFTGSKGVLYEAITGGGDSLANLQLQWCMRQFMKDEHLEGSY